MNNKTKLKVAGALLIASLAVAGIVGYLNLDGEEQYLTYEEYKSLIVLYNEKLQEIKDDCGNDVRCVEKDGEKKVVFREADTKEGLIDEMNGWIEDDAKDPGTYKINK